MQWSKLGEREFGLVPLASLVQSRENYRRMTPESFEALKESIRVNGFSSAILVARLPGEQYRVVDGHHRWQAAEECGLTAVPAVLLTHEEASNATTLAMLTFNISAEIQSEPYLALIRELQAGFDADALARAVALPKSFLDDLAATFAAEVPDVESASGPDGTAVLPPSTTSVDRSRGTVMTVPLPRSPEVAELLGHARVKAVEAGLAPTDSQAVLWALREARKHSASPAAQADGAEEN